jgi:hypothetical protein
MKTIADIKAATTSELVAFWNEHAESQIKKFSDRKTAEARCIKLLEGLIATGDIDAGSEKKTEDEDLKAAAESATKAAKAAEAAAESAKAAAKTVETVVKHHEEIEKRDAVGASWLREAEAAANAKKAQGGTPKEVSEAAQKASLAHRSASNAAGVAASWHDPEVRAARQKRDGVTVEVDGKKTSHKSTRDAFRHYRLPDSKHIRFRMRLKESRSEVFEHNGKKYKFTMGSDE